MKLCLQATLESEGSSGFPTKKYEKSSWQVKFCQFCPTREEPETMKHWKRRSLLNKKHIGKKHRFQVHPRKLTAGTPNHASLVQMIFLFVLEWFSKFYVSFLGINNFRSWEGYNTILLKGRGWLTLWATRTTKEPAFFSNTWALKSFTIEDGRVSIDL